MSLPPRPSPVAALRGHLQRHLRPSDLRGVAQLATQATLGVTQLAEGVHQQVWQTLGAPGGAQPGSTRGVTGLVYRTVQGVTRGVGGVVGRLLAAAEPLLGQPTPGDSAERDAVLAALNGVMGDTLAATGNPLATTMQFRRRGPGGTSVLLDPLQPNAWPAVTGKVLLLVHGLCMNDRQWQTGSGQVPGHDHGQYLARELGYTPVYLRYNTGLPIEANGRLLAQQLHQLLSHWPVPVQELSLLTHSMGGLVVRCAVRAAEAAAPQAPLPWLVHLKHIVFLGTPHHGAPLERAGHGVDLLLSASRWSRPFARLGQLRSAGITDLRHGDALPLPAGVACHAVAATLAARRSRVAERLTGDGLVPLHSALGQHTDDALSLGFAPGSLAVVHRCGHLQLLGSPEVAQHLRGWLAAR